MMLSPNTSLAVSSDWQQDFILNTAFTEAFEILENSQQPLFITGKAGTGKSTFLDYFRKTTRKKIAVLAPTGVAALNINGQTIHSFFGLKPAFLDPNKRLAPRNKAMIKALDILIIDEISMVRADIFDALCAMLQEHGPRPRAPFGGVQLCLIGDLFQLPPVVGRGEEEVFSHFYEGPYFFYAKRFNRQQFMQVNFDNVYRQQDDTFVGILNAIRSGQISADALEILNDRATPQHLPSTGGLLTLTPRVAQADAINRQCLEALPGSPCFYEGKAKGIFANEGANLPVPMRLGLKVGAQVMFTRNDNTDGRWVNGTLGVVRTLKDKEIEVEISQQGRARLVTVTPDKWQTVKYGLNNGQLTQEETGSYTQMPLMHAWAVTIHKSQGKTLENVVIDLGAGAFAPGQLYVALSRCKTLVGIRLTRPVRSSDVAVDPRVVDFMRGV